MSGGLRRLFWLSVAAAIFFTADAGYHFYRQRVVPPVSIQRLLGPVQAARGEAEVRAKAEILARAAQHASSSAWHGKRGTASLAMAAAFLFLWMAVSLSRLRKELPLPDGRGGGAPAKEQLDVILKRLETPDEVRVFEKGRLEIVRIGSMTVGRASYEPGWRWSVHVGPTVGADRCTVEHVGMVLSGTATAALGDGRVIELAAGSLFHIPAVAHDSWVVGNEPYVSLHFMGADQYARA